MMQKKFTILLAMLIAGVSAKPPMSMPMPTSMTTTPPNMGENDESYPSSSESDENDGELQRIWDVLMSKVKNVTLKVVNVPADEMVVKSVCGPNSCLYDIVDLYNLTLPVLVPVVPDNATVSLDFNSTSATTSTALDEFPPPWKL